MESKIILQNGAGAFLKNNGKYLLMLRSSNRGIANENINNLKLRYIIIRQYKNIVRQNYIYFGETNITELLKTDEGTLHWINENELLEKEYTRTYTEMMRHYIKTPDPEERIVVGIAGKLSGKLKMNWSILEDFE